MAYVGQHLESAEKRGLLASDNNLIECLSEATTYQMPSILRRLFATLLVYCNPANPKDLWQKFKGPMSEEFTITTNIQTTDIRYIVLNHINTILHSMGRNINEFKLISKNFTPFTFSYRITQESRDIYLEKNIVVTEEDLLLYRKLNKEQHVAYNVILNKIFSNETGVFYIDGPGGTGKTFLYCALLATVRSKGLIALATTTSGVATSVLPGGRTAHSRFKLPININENYNCNISKQSSLAALIQDTKLIVWGEVSMATKILVKTFDLLLRDLMSVNIPFGGKVIVFRGDFRQTLPVLKSETKEDFIRECLQNSNI
ncbi:uncharacterized protein LOC107859447 [Capsicum annuum]|uniref:uncharacterized protein LOC107859447 n=1 Tax=Capsicum annuum TaxID=4072 RepID=UPI001FB11B0B|nr:uncharacterized protein LOC107859447 [Capsicum annuum]XP_047262929.1 uncharacterized protein LOC107859447 [Capsicum annuum]XP_047262930.1 uncharacterized protein LOC107859447 [Capsicum annuum]